MERAQARDRRNPEVFTVTLEGGERLGGVSQVPKPGKEAEKPPLDAIPEEALNAPPPPSNEKKQDQDKIEKQKKQAEEEKIKEAEKTKALEQLTLVEEMEKRKKEAEERKKKEEEEKKKKLEEQKKKAEQAKKDEEAKKKSEEEAKKKKLQEEIARKQKEERDKIQAKKDRDKRLSELAREIKSKKDYEGESVRAGGEGFGGARIGGSGGGGGTLAPYAKVAYQNELQAHVKSGWRWMQRSDRLRTLVRVRISPTGDISEVRILEGSGNSNFDDSVVRAVKKASPVPPAPREFYSDFADVRFWFDSSDQ